MPFVFLRLFDSTMESTDYGEVIVSNGARIEQSGNYTCVARNKVGNASVVYLVDVLGELFMLRCLFEAIFFLNKDY